MVVRYLSTIWEVSHGGEEGVLGVKDAGLAHVPDFEACDQAGHQHTCLAPQLNHIPCTCMSQQPSQALT